MEQLVQNFSLFSMFFTKYKAETVTPIVKSFRNLRKTATNCEFNTHVIWQC